jgi:hypothetical protein
MAMSPICTIYPSAVRRIDLDLEPANRGQNALATVIPSAAAAAAAPPASRAADAMEDEPEIPV